MEENKEITPQEELENILKVFSQISNRLGVYASSEQFKNVKGSFSQATARTVEASHWVESAYRSLFINPPGVPREEKKEEKISE